MSRKETQRNNAINKLKSRNQKRHFYGHKALHEELGMNELVGGKNRYGQLPIGFIANMTLQMTSRETKIFGLILEETYNAGYLEWHYSQGMIRRLADKYRLEGLLDNRNISHTFKAMHQAGVIINDTKTGNQLSVVKICHGTFVVENFEKLDHYRTIKTKTGKKNRNPQRGVVFKTKDLLLDLGCNTYANSAGLFNFSGDEQGDNLGTSSIEDSNTNLGTSIAEVDTQLGTSNTQVNTCLGTSNTQVNHANNAQHSDSCPPKSTYKSSIKREEERETSKDGQILAFINLLRAEYQGMIIQVADGTKYYFDRGGWLREYAGDKKVVTGLALGLYKRFYAKKDVLIEYLHYKKQQQKETK